MTSLFHKRLPFRIGVNRRGVLQRTVTIRGGLFKTIVLRRRYVSSMKYSNRGADNDGNKILVYEGPLASTYRKLKGFSLTSLGVASSMTPFFFVVDTSLPLGAKVILASTVFGASSISTAFIGWCGKPYVSRLWRDENGVSLEMETTTLFLKKRFTTVYDWKMFLRESERPFAKWELAKEVERRSTAEDGELPEEETVAETTDENGNTIGRWIVRWHRGDNDGDIIINKGICFAEGRIVRFVYFILY